MVPATLLQVLNWSSEHWQHCIRPDHVMAMKSVLD